VKEKQKRVMIYTIKGSIRNFKTQRRCSTRVSRWLLSKTSFAFLIPIRIVIPTTLSFKKKIKDIASDIRTLKSIA